MAVVIDVSSSLGEYMLKGWVLTDKSCPTPGCNVPLLRSPNGTSPVVHFCANCDGHPNPLPSGSSAHPPDGNSLAMPSPSIAPSTHYSQSSTPATEVSSALSSPTFAPPLDTEESLRRRRQSDEASAEIGKRLLKGWAMLADECPNARCYGVPLVRPPKTGGGKDPRKECVACGTVYVDEKDANGWDRLVPLDPSSGNQRRSGEREAGSSSAVSSSAALAGRDKGKAVAHDETPVASKRSLPSSMIGSTPSLAFKHPRLDTPEESRPPLSEETSQTSTRSALEASSSALEAALLSLSGRLSQLSRSHNVIDPSLIGQTADAIGRVTQALGQVKKVQSDTQ